MLVEVILQRLSNHCPNLKECILISEHAFNNVSKLKNSYSVKDVHGLTVLI